MKWGMRAPSLKKRIAARTSVKRYVRHSLGAKAPRGWGWFTNPRKAAYNRVYNRTTFSIFDLFGSKKRGGSSEGGIQDGSTPSSGCFGCFGCFGVLAILFLFCGVFGLLLPDPPEQIARLDESGQETSEPESVAPTRKYVAPKSEPLIPYSIVEQQNIPGIKRSYEVRVDLVNGRLPNREELEAVAKHLHSDSHERNFVSFWLPGMQLGSGAFATGHKGPAHEFKIRFLFIPDRYAGIGFKTPEPADQPLRIPREKTAAEKPPVPAYRTWTSAKGGHAIEATMLAVVADQVKLKRRDGKELSVLLSKLSLQDQAYALGDPNIANFPNVIQGRVVAITDGDTVVVLDEDSERFKIRLQGIDAPEKGQAYGTKSRKALAEKIFRKDVKVRWKERDRYDRVVGIIYYYGRSINREMVFDGWAWHYKKYSDDPELAAVETAARKKRSGLWADPNQPIPPWDYRRDPKAYRAPVTTPTLKPTNAIETHPRPPPQRQTYRHWLNTSSYTRYNSACRHYKNTKRGRMCGPNEGSACGICGG